MAIAVHSLETTVRVNDSMKTKTGRNEYSRWAALLPLQDVAAKYLSLLLFRSIREPWREEDSDARSRRPDCDSSTCLWK